MIRSFLCHRIRNIRELTGRLWDFHVLPGNGTQARDYNGLPVSTDTRKVMTPCCWQTLPGFASFRGVGVYSTVFQAGGNLALECKGISHTATLFLDGQEIARHYNAYTPFRILIKDLPEGLHTLTIHADNRFSPDSALHIPNDYMSYGGISRPVVLEQLSDAYIKSLKITPVYNGSSWQVKITVTVENITDSSLKADLNLEIAGAGEGTDEIAHCHLKDCVLPANSIFTHTFEAECPNVREWSPDSPSLYEVRTMLSADGTAFDDLIDRFGFRQISVEGKQLLLNRKPLSIRGFCRHEDHPQYGQALPKEAMAYDLMLLKDLHANSIRTAHYPNDELFLDLCDEMGFLVWEENHARGLSEEDMRNPHFEQQAEEVIREMIPAHYNHPCIYIWGILNECASDTPYGYECYRRQLELIRSLDGTRPCSFASCKFKTDISFGLVDVVSYNIYPLWYHNTPPAEYLEDLYSWVQTETEGKGKPFLITEIGAGGLYGYHNPEHSHWTEEYQARVLKEQVEAVLRHPDCIGLYLWQFADIRISEEWWATRPRTMNNKGIVDEFRRPKQAYEIIKELFGRN